MHVEFFATSNDYHYYKPENLKKNVLNINVSLFGTNFF